MEFSEKRIYHFEDVEVDTSRGNLKCGDNERHLRKKAFSVLVSLLENRERLVTKEELMQTVWKDTAVTDDVLVQCVKEIRRAIGDDSHQPRFIKTIPKSGYRFIGSVNEVAEKKRKAATEFLLDGDERRATTESVYYFSHSSPDQQPPNNESRQNSFLFRSRRFVLFSGFTVVIIFTLLGLLGQGLWQSDRKSSEPTLTHKPGKKTLAVMFFENQSKSADIDWLREGLMDMLVTNLSRSAKLTILSRQQLHLLLERYEQHEGDEIGLDKSLEIGRKSQAEAIVVGSFARLGEKIRLDVQIFNTENGSVQATESLIADKPEQILTGIDLLSLKLANHLGTNEPEIQHPLSDLMTDNLEAYRYYSIGVEKAQAIHNKEAVELLEKAVALDPQFAMAYARIGYVYTVSWGQSDKGKPFLEKAFKLSDKLTEKDQLNIDAWYAIANHDFDRAIQVFREYIVKYPLENESYWRLARLLVGEERPEEAIEVLKQGLAIDSEAKDIYNTLGSIYSALGRHDEAVEARQRYVALAPAEANAYDSLGLVYHWAGNYPLAIENYNRALELNPTFDVAVVHLANTRFALGQYREALNLYRRYIQIAPSDNERIRGYNSITTVYLEKGDVDSAEKSNHEALKINRQNYWFSYLIALKLEKVNQAKKLENKIFLASAFNNRGARITRRYDFYSRGFLAQKNGQPDFAQENFKEALRRLPPNWDIDAYEDCLAKAYLEAGKIDESIAEFNRVLKLNPNYPKAYFYLGLANSRLGKFTESGEFYRRFLQTWANADPDIPEIIAAKKFLEEQK